MDFFRISTSRSCESTVTRGKWPGIYHLDVGIHIVKRAVFWNSLSSAQSSLIAAFLCCVAVIHQTHSNHPI